ncbi:hypothetical protein OL233_05115 [Vagococcus sp. PNs007]|uniref:Uncharacterized protein n=1 Tax=Vagococcus proximus TaxID=2991417 RepID=A0ABT5X0Y8_9ENTE|nr:hypothetical protein [Vagococcus proximus]MDF0479663.1 hypothetical protein [Vagococcus proximus]
MIVVGIIVIFIILAFYMVWGIKQQSEIRVSGDYKNFGFSYIGIAQALNLLISLIVGTLAAIILTTVTGIQIIALLVGVVFVITLVVYYLLNFSIVKFRNTAIIAKTNTEILKKLKQLHSLQEENNGKTK